jgi:hypothetical protein
MMSHCRSVQMSNQKRRFNWLSPGGAIWRADGRQMSPPITKCINARRQVPGADRSCQAWYAQNDRANRRPNRCVFARRKTST